MAVKDERRPTRSNGTGRGTIADKEYPVSDAVVGTGGDVSYSGGPDKRGFFDLYKPGQGFYTRVWSGVAYGVLVAWFAVFLYDKLSLLGDGPNVKIVQIAAAVVVILGLGVLGYWALALNRKVCDFLIATEGEMKKVNWTSRKEIIGSTKVVIFVMLALAVILFVVDILFMLFFTSIGVLKGGGIIETIKGMF